VIVRDHEVLEVLRDEPELLAIADAIGISYPRRRRRRRWAVAVGSVTAVAAVVTLVLVAPWKAGGLNFTDRALAAIGNGPILHLKDRYKRFGVAVNQDVRVDLRTGRRQRLVLTQEVWADQITGLRRTINRVDGSVVDARVTTTCSNLPNGPQAGERVCIPGLLTGFDFDQQYREPLARGLFRRIGSGVFRGRPVVWLELTRQPPRYPRIRVGVDSETYKPLVFRIFAGNRLFVEDDLLVLESLPSGSVRFRVPKGGAPYYGHVPRVSTRAHPAGIAAAGNTLRATPLWLRRDSGYVLDSVRVGVERALGKSGAILASSPFVRLRYHANRPRRVLLIDEFTGRPAKSLWRQEGVAVPPAGAALHFGRYWTARLGPVLARVTAPATDLALIESLKQLQRSGVHPTLKISYPSTDAQILAAVRALQPRSAPK
jgi:hypothetical protein